MRQCEVASVELLSTVDEDARAAEAERDSADRVVMVAAEGLKVLGAPRPPPADERESSGAAPVNTDEHVVG